MEELDRSGEKLDNLDRILSGGTTVPEWIIKKFKNDYGVHLIHAWGMTETSPLGTANSPLGTQDNLSDNQNIEKMYSAGRPNWSVQIKIVDEILDDAVSWEVYEIINEIPTRKIINEGLLPNETKWLDDFVDFEKGCFLGQEQASRIKYRGNPRRVLITNENGLQEMSKI